MSAISTIPWRLRNTPPLCAVTDAHLTIAATRRLVSAALCPAAGAGNVRHPRCMSPLVLPPLAGRLRAGPQASVDSDLLLFRVPVKRSGRPHSRPCGGRPLIPPRCFATGLHAQHSAFEADVRARAVRIPKAARQGTAGHGAPMILSIILVRRWEVLRGSVAPRARSLRRRRARPQSVASVARASCPAPSPFPSAAREGKRKTLCGQTVRRPSASWRNVPVTPSSFRSRLKPMTPSAFAT